MAKIAVILSGCGYLDGAEIHESVITLLALDSNEAEYQCFAPNIPQMHVVNHVLGEPAASESRQVLTEAARIARGQVQDLRECRAEEFDAIIFPGGFGAAKNLCDFAVAGTQMRVQTDVLSTAQDFAKAGKPAGFICIAPVMIAAIYGPGVTCTIGNDQEIAEALTRMGCRHQDCAVDDIVVDTQHKVVTTPAYMLANRISEAAAGIEKLVRKILELASI